MIASESATSAAAATAADNGATLVRCECGGPRFTVRVELAGVAADASAEADDTCLIPALGCDDGATAARGAAAAAASRGIAARVCSTTVEGEARLVGTRLGEAARRLAPGEMEVHAGETTVTVAGQGKGGRNQEVALAAGITLAGDPGGSLVASFATDGVDGPTDAAGGIGDTGTMGRGPDRGLDAAACLAGNDSYRYLAAAGGLLRCGPTGTNVGDVMIAYRPRRT